MARWGVLALVFFAGCSVEVDHTVHFKDGATVECITNQAETDLFNKVVIASCEPSKPTVQTFVTNGTTAVAAATGLVQAGALAAFPALLGTGSSSATVNVGPAK